MRMVFGTRLLIFMLAATITFRVSVSAQANRNQADMSMDGNAKAEVIASVAKALRVAYVFPDVGDAVAKILEERDARGEYNAIRSAKVFSDLLDKQMSEAAGDKHLGFAYSFGVLPVFPVSKGGEPPPSPNPAAELRQARARNYGFEKVERLGGNLGYLKFNAFAAAEGGDAVAAGAMALLANTDALIIDLRENQGGGGSMLAFLSSYFFASRVHLSDFAFRIAGTTDYKITETWTMADVPGRRYIGKQIYILTSRRTFSLAEAFTVALQSLSRATVVGETTGGGANGGGPYRISDHFFVSMPMGHLDNPVTKTNWEGKGIEPDVKVPEQEALKTAQRLALQHLIDKTTNQQALAALKQALTALDASR